MTRRTIQPRGSRSGRWRHCSRGATAYYYATISQIDFQVGRTVDLLRRRGLYDNTLIVYTSDHGDYMGFHHLMLKGNHLYDPLAKIPLIIKLPGQGHAGTASESLVRAESEGGGQIGKEYMARTRSQKLLLCADQGESQFFDLEVDPLELENRIDDPGCSEQVAALRDALLRWSLFDSPSRVYLDQAAPVIRGKDTPGDPAASAKEVEAYFRRRMTE